MFNAIKTICEILAYASAAAFFIFKAYSGAFYVSLSLALNTDKRRILNEREDLLVIDLTLTGGENALLNIYKIEGRIRYGNEIQKYFDFEGPERLTVKNDNNDLIVINPWINNTVDKYRISSKETTSFANQLIVPNDAICYIEILVVGSRKKFIRKRPTISQWRISHIALPNHT